MSSLLYHPTDWSLIVLSVLVMVFFLYLTNLSWQEHVGRAGNWKCRRLKQLKEIWHLEKKGGSPGRSHKLGIVWQVVSGHHSSTPSVAILVLCTYHPSWSRKVCEVLLSKHFLPYFQSWGNFHKHSVHLKNHKQVKHIKLGIIQVKIKVNLNGKTRFHLCSLGLLQHFV